jgi:transcriptional regulator with XRE-family HTH domain
LRGEETAVSEQFGRNLAEARGWAGLSQAQLAKQIGMAQAEVARIEIGTRHPRLDKIVKFADALGVQVRDLLFEIE